MFARYYRLIVAREREDVANSAALHSVIADSLAKLPPGSRDRVYAAAELARKWNAWPKNPELRLRVRNASYWQAQKSKIGDDYLLSEPETKAFHDLLNLGRQQWATFMSALVRRENWAGPADPAAIEAAAKEAGVNLPEGKRLLLLAEAVRTVQGAMERPYFPAMRFGDIYLAVTPKPGPDIDTVSLAKGRPELQWFQTVERPSMRDLLGRNRLPPDQMPEVQQAIAALSARKDAHGNQPFGGEFKNTSPGVWESATHRTETDDLSRSPDVLRQLNIPAIEKLFMLLERHTEQAVVARVMGESTPYERLPPKEAAELKRRVTRYGPDAELKGAEPRESYNALLAAAKETLLDEIYRALLAGWKKEAKLTPGYSDDFERAIGTHMGQVARNAADMVYRDEIEAAYQNIQDNHPNQSVRLYTRDFQREQDDPPSRAAPSQAEVEEAPQLGRHDDDDDVSQRTNVVGAERGSVAGAGDAPTVEGRHADFPAVALSKHERGVAIATAGAILLASAFPPFHYRWGNYVNDLGYSFLFSPPHLGDSAQVVGYVNLGTLLIEYVGILAIGALAWLFVPTLRAWRSGPAAER